MYAIRSYYALEEGHGQHAGQEAPDVGQEGHSGPRGTGVERPLRTAAHFDRFKDERVRISLVVGIDGRRNFTGQLLGVDSSSDPMVLIVV